MLRLTRKAKKLTYERIMHPHTPLCACGSRARTPYIEFHTNTDPNLRFINIVVDTPTPHTPIFHFGSLQIEGVFQQLL